jgi:hypothetical protein
MFLEPKWRITASALMMQESRLDPPHRNVARDLSGRCSC